MLAHQANAEATLPGGAVVKVIFKDEAGVTAFGGGEIAQREPFITGLANQLGSLPNGSQVVVASPARGIQPTSYTTRRTVPATQLGHVSLVLKKA